MSILANNQKSFLAVVCCCILLCSCSGGKSKVSDQTISEINLLESTEVTSLENYIETVDCVVLKGDSVMVVSPKKILLTDNYLLVLHSGVVDAFDRDGTFCRHIGRRGRGPDEYLFVVDCCISCASGSSSGVIPYTNGNFALLFLNPEDKCISDYSSDFYCLKIYNKRGQIIKEELKRKDFNIMMSFRSPVIQSLHNKYVVSYLPGNGPCYISNGNSTKPLFRMNFGDKGLPNDYTKKAPEPILMINEIFDSDYFKCASSTSITDGHLFCSAFGAHSSYWNFVFDLESHKGVRWQSFGEEAPPISALCADDKYFYFYLGEQKALSSQHPEMIKDPLVRAMVFNLKAEEIKDEYSAPIVKVKFKRLGSL